MNGMLVSGLIEYLDNRLGLVSPYRDGEDDDGAGG